MQSKRPAFLLLAVVLCFAGACTRVEVRRDRAPRASAVMHEPARVEAAKDLQLAMPHLLQSINATRQSRGAPELRVDRGLALVAERAAEQYQRLGRGFEQRVAARANADLRSFSLTFSRVTALVVFVERLEQAETVLGPAMDPDMLFVGMCVSKSPPPTSVQGGYAVVMALGR